MKAVPVRADERVNLPESVALSAADEAVMRARLALPLHQSMCWVRGEQTPDGYVWWIEDHEPGDRYSRCGQALETIAEFGNWRLRGRAEGTSVPPHPLHLRPPHRAQAMSDPYDVFRFLALLDGPRRENRQWYVRAMHGSLAGSSRDLGRVVSRAWRPYERSIVRLLERVP